MTAAGSSKTFISEFPALVLSKLSCSKHTTAINYNKPTLLAISKDGGMKTPGPLHAAWSAVKSHFDHTDKPDTGKKSIPVARAIGEQGKALLDRRMKTLGSNPPTFHDVPLEKEELSIALWSHWTGQPQEKVRAHCSQLEKVNGSALLTIRQLLSEGHKVYSCQVPGVLVLTGKDVFSDLPGYICKRLDHALEGAALHDRIWSSDGVLKTPIMIAWFDNEKPLMRKESLERLSSCISFYPFVETAKRSDTSMLTLYVDGQNMDDAALTKGLRQGIKRAVHKADDNLPKLPDISEVSTWTDLMDHYGVTTQAQLLHKFKAGRLDELPDLSNMSSWSALPDRYLLSREIIQKYLR